MLYASASTHPLTAEYQAQNFGYLPDVVTDTTRKRRRKARQLFGDGAGVICRLLACPNRNIYHVVLPLFWCDLYGTAPAVAREELQTLLGDAPRYVRLASGLEWTVHVHALVALTKAEAAAFQKKNYCVLVKDDKHLQALAEYFSRPPLEAAARPKPEALARYTLQELAQKKLAAAEYYLVAKKRAKAEGKRLPCLSWTQHLPRLKPDLPTWKPTRAAFKRPLKVLMWSKEWLPSMRRADDFLLRPFVRGLSWGLPRSRAPPAKRVMQSTTAAADPYS